LVFLILVFLLRREHPFFVYEIEEDRGLASRSELIHMLLQAERGVEGGGHCCFKLALGQRRLV